MVVAFNFTFGNVCYSVVTAHSIQGKNKRQIWLTSTMFIKKNVNLRIEFAETYIAINMTQNSSSVYLLPIAWKKMFINNVIGNYLKQLV